MGFAITLFMCEIAGLTATAFFAVMITFYVAICWYFVSCLDDLMTIPPCIDDIYKKSSLTTMNDERKIRKHLLEFIRFHAWTKRLVYHEILLNFEIAKPTKI